MLNPIGETVRSSCRSRVTQVIQLLGNTIDGFQFAITLDRQRGGRYRDVVIRGSTGTRSRLVGKRSENAERIVIESNTEPVQQK